MAKTDSRINFLARVPLFKSLTDRQLERLATRFISRNYAPNEAILTQGKGGEGLFTLLSGRAEAVLESSDGSRIVLNTFGPTDFFGEIALLDDGPRTASVVATEDSECLVITRSDFLAVMKNDAEMGVAISRELAKRIRRALSSI